MKWYKKQLDAILKDQDEKKEGKKTTGPSRIGGSRSFHNPVAAKNINRPKTDKP